MPSEYYTHKAHMCAYLSATRIFDHVTVAPHNLHKDALDSRHGTLTANALIIRGPFTGHVAKLSPLHLGKIQPSMSSFTSTYCNVAERVTS